VDGGGKTVRASSGGKKDSIGAGASFHMGNLASTYRSQGRYTEAEKLVVQVIEVRKTVLGLEHPDTLASVNNLASIYWNQGRWAEAEKVNVQVMEAFKTVLGPEHPD
jgi:Tetratricopeptide repeat